MSNQYIAIEGNLGAGKTSLATQLSEMKKGKLILEGFEDNPFLESFYEDQNKYAFPVELHFMMERVRQMEDIYSGVDLFNDLVISDYFFDKTKLFASNNLSKREYKLFLDIFDKVSRDIPFPEVIVYLHRPINALISNIHKRGREYEMSITPDYLREIEHQYFNYFNSLSDQTIIIFEMEEIGDIFDREVLLFIISMISKWKNSREMITISSRS